MKARCAKCQAEFGGESSGSPRQPCPHCGSIARNLSAAVNEGMKAGDHASAVIRNPEGEATAFTESTRGGQASGAQLTGESVSGVQVGQPVQGEADTESCCKTLVRHLNDEGGAWVDLEIEPPNEPDLDGRAVDSRGTVPPLRIQVVRADVDPTPQLQLRREGRAEQTSQRTVLADQIRTAIDHKSNPRKIPPQGRHNLVLVLDATRRPDLTLDRVVADFRTRHAKAVSTLGFAAIWLVGPVRSMVWRLDG